MKPLVKVLVLSIVCSVAACSSSPSKRGGNEATISLRVVSAIEQQGLKVQFNTSPAAMLVGAAVGGLPGLAVYKGIENARKADSGKMRPFNDALEKTDVRRMLDESLKAGAQSVYWADTNFLTAENAGHKKRGEFLLGMEEDILLWLTTSYTLTPEMESLEVVTEVGLYKEQHKSMDMRTRKQIAKKTDPFFRGGIQFQSKLYGGRYVSTVNLTVEERKQAIVEKYDEKIANIEVKSNATKRTLRQEMKRSMRHELKGVDSKIYDRLEGEVDTQGGAWLENNGKLLKDTIELAAAEISEVLPLLLNDALSSAKNKKSKTNFLTARMGGASKTRLHRKKSKGWLVSETDSRQRIRLADGYIYSIAKGDFIRLVLQDEKRTRH